MQQAAAASPFFGADPATPETEALLEAGRLSTLGELVRGVAHEINNPLFGMLGLVDLLLADLEPGSPEYDRLLLVKQSGLEIKQLSHALLRFAQAEPDDIRVVSLHRVAEEAVELVRCTNADKSVELREDYCRELLEVRGSHARLGQVFLSLLVNAQQALPAGGMVTVRLERDGTWAVATVTDTGDGVDPSIRMHLFEPFTTTKAGTGLGLAASHQIARAHGGNLTAVSSLETGGTFVLKLPLAGGAQ
jgi:two-component system, NtrC family, sensor kinase